VLTSESSYRIDAFSIKSHYKNEKRSCRHLVSSVCCTNAHVYFKSQHTVFVLAIALKRFLN